MDLVCRHNPGGLSPPRCFRVDGQRCARLVRPHWGYEDKVVPFVGAILEAAGSGLDRVVKTTVYLTDLDDFERVNRVYAELVPSPPPARVCVEVSRLPRGARVEIDAVALVD